MNYDEALAYIDSLAPTILNPDLTRFAAFMELHNRPQDRVPAFHVAGTNGKGSTVAMIDSALRAAGYKVGRYTGPHLLRWNERFQVNGVAITDEKLAELATRLRGLSEDFGREHPEHGSLTWFELLTAIAFFWFAESGLDFAVYEVGLGGRWDATNVLSAPLVSVITTIDFDHTHILGNTIAEIAAEKAGIIKIGKPVVTGTTGEALKVIRDKAGLSSGRGAGSEATCARGAHSPVYEVAPSDTVACRNYQQLNALIAKRALEVAGESLGLALADAFEEGLKRVYWPGRLQWLPNERLLMDGAHNVGGARALRQAVDERFPNERRIFVLGFFQNKDVPGALEHLLRAGDIVIASQAKTSRAVCSAELIAEKAREIGAEVSTAPTISDALEKAIRMKTGDDVVVATGSFATVKETMLAMGWRTVEDGMKLTYSLIPEESARARR